MGKREWFGAALVAFGIGCGEPGNEGRGTGDAEDTKGAKVEKAPEEAVNRPVNNDFIVPGEKDIRSMTCDVETGNVAEIKTKASESEQESSVETERKFRNVLMEEADNMRPEDWLGDKYDEEVKRLKGKLPKDVSKNKFGNSLEQLHWLFVPRDDDAKNGVEGLLRAFKDGKNTRFLVNKEYRDKVKGFVEKYSAQYGVPVEIVYGVMAVENAGKHDPNKNKADGAYGIMQVKPDLVDEMARLYPNEDWSDVSVSDLEGNIRTGAAYLKFLNNRYGGQWWASLMAYNAGHAGFERDFVAALEGSLASRAKLRGEIRQTKKQIKELKKAEVVDEQAVRVLEAKLQVETEKLKIHGERLNQLRTRVARNKGWSKVVGKEGFYRIISKKGRGMYANSNARYVVEAMCLGPKLGEVMSSQSEEVKLTPLVDEIK